jgi:ketosteroid isomerase-like protein
MPTPVPRHVVEGFYQALIAACARRDLDQLVPYLHNDVKWTINGPVAVLTFSGTRSGPAAVLDLVQRVAPRVVRITAFKRDELLVDGDRAAAFARLTGVLAATSATISYRLAQFMRFHAGQVIEFRAIIDSFDATEQVLGRPIELLPDIRREPPGHLVAV